MFLFGGGFGKGEEGSLSKKRLARFTSAKFCFGRWKVEIPCMNAVSDDKVKDEDYEDDMYLECGSWKDHHGSMMNMVGLN